MRALRISLWLSGTALCALFWFAVFRLLLGVPAGTALSILAPMTLVSAIGLAVVMAPKAGREDC